MFCLQFIYKTSPHKTTFKFLQLVLLGPSGDFVSNPTKAALVPATAPRCSMLNYHLILKLTYHSKS